MENVEIKEQFERLNLILKEERQAAISLDMDALQQSTQAKKALLAKIEDFPKDTEGLRDLLLEIDKENRRNAYLLWTGLGWVRGMMDFFGKSTVPSSYGHSGKAHSCQRGGNLLSGKI